MNRVSGEELYRWKIRFLLYYLDQSESPLIPEWIRRQIRESWQRLDKLAYESDIEKLWRNRDLIGMEEHA
ncbi:MAG: hypothetical protein ACTSQ8_23525 [Candidatus Helarchaeota archaeon]